jgi:hypothetical protein
MRLPESKKPSFFSGPPHPAPPLLPILVPHMLTFSPILPLSPPRGHAAAATRLAGASAALACGGGGFT